MKVAAFCLLALASPAFAAPPPPPPPQALNAVQAYIRAITAKDADAYIGLLSSAFSADDDEIGGQVDRSTWITAIKRELANPRLHIVVMQVFFGGQLSYDGNFAWRVMIVENANNFSFGNNRAPDCCAFYRTETLTLDGDKITRIDRSAPFDTVLSPTGMRTDQ